MTLPTHPLGNSRLPVRPTACRDPVVEIDTFIVDGLYGGGHESL
jgi:hypothetical protein